MAQGCFDNQMVCGGHTIPEYSRLPGVCALPAAGECCAIPYIYIILGVWGLSETRGQTRCDFGGALPVFNIVQLLYL